MNNKKQTEPATEKSNVCYSCDECNTLAMSPGRCEMCGRDMSAKHLIGVEAGMAQVCTCPETCSCASADENDPSRCTCGEPITEISLEGKYMCGCGIACPTCTAISDRPGTCDCGEEMELVE
jgi:hypothetical protein